jgi:hypothetical protein
VAWFIGVVGGYFIGLFVSSTIGIPDRPRRFSHVGRYADLFFEAFYIIPLVLTLSLGYSLVMSFYTKYDFPRFFIVIFMISLAGLTLGGYNVYKSVYLAVRYAKRESCYITESLYFRNSEIDLRNKDITGWWRELGARINTVKRLRDIEIRSILDTLPRALHLSIVSVMILESITPSFYEHVLPQSGMALSWLGGTGRQILTAQQNNQFELIAGCVWTVLCFDWICSWFIERTINFWWLRHYTRRG